MGSGIVAGVDRAGDQWLAVTFDGRSYEDCSVEKDFKDLWEDITEVDLVLVDVPIGLPENEETLTYREELDSLARKVTGRPSSVFSVPSREAVRKAHDGQEYEEVSKQNKKDIQKGLSRQSYHIAAGIGEIDTLLQENKQARDRIIESHPEVCFRGLLGRRLEHSKKSAPGVGERLEALGKHLENPGKLLENVTTDLVGEVEDVEVDDVIDAVGLGIIAGKSEAEPLSLPENPELDDAGIPMQMAYWADESLLPCE